MNLAEGSLTPTGEDGTPTNFKVLAIADLRTWRENGWGGHATMGYYQNVGTVFTGGTMNWALNLLATPRDPIVETITRNVINRLSDRVPVERWTTTEFSDPEEDEWKEINTGTDTGGIPMIGKSFFELTMPDKKRMHFLNEYKRLKEDGQVINTKEELEEKIKSNPDGFKDITAIFQELINQNNGALRSFLDAGAMEILARIERMEEYVRALDTTKTIEKEAEKLSFDSLSKLLREGNVEEFTRAIS